MIHSLFIINSSGEIFLDKHWKSIIPRSVCDYVFEEQRKSKCPEDVPVIINTPCHFLINIYRNNLFFIAVVIQEVDIFQEYFGECNETNIKENYVVVYELLDEMLDSGFPLVTESNVLKELIKPPTIFRSIANTVTGKSNVSTTLPTGQLSNVPWRRAGVRYTNNEAYFDVIEEVDAILDRTGTTISSDIYGHIDCCVKLSGMPDLLMTFINPQLMDDVALHACVRLRRWETERLLSFVPPDGSFHLMNYHIGNLAAVAIPVYVRHSLSFQNGEGKLDLTITAKQTMGRTLENVSVEMYCPTTVISCSLSTTQGRYTFDPVIHLLVWEVGKMDLGRSPNLHGSIILQAGTYYPEGNSSIRVHFTINQLAISGLKVSRLLIYGERYKPFKGVRYVTKDGNFYLRQ